MNLNHFLVFFGSGTIIPVLVSVFSSPRWPRGVRAVLAFVISVGVGIWETRAQWIPGDWWANGSLVFGAVYLAYNGILKHVGLPALERGTASAWAAFLQQIINRAKNEPETEGEGEDDLSLRIGKLDGLLLRNVITEVQHQQKIEQIRAEALEAI